MSDMKRHQLPPRRHCLTTIVQWDNKDWLIALGFDDAWRVREIFGDGHKTGSHMEAILDDVCLLISFLLQHGMEVATLADKLGREGADPQAPAASFIGLIVKHAAEIERGYQGEAA